MNRIKSLGIVCLYLLMAEIGLTITACSSEDETIDTPKNQLEELDDSVVIDMLPTTRAIELTESQKGFVAKNNEFSFNFYRAINKADNSKSNITSPLSLTYLMGMLADGANGKTAEEITTMLGFGAGDKTAVNEYCQALIKQSPIADPSVVLEMANIVAANKMVEQNPAYQQEMKDYYEAEAVSLDFSQPSSKDYLNDWCNQKTHGMIPKVIDNLDNSILLVLMNAIYFNATWTEKFDPADTKDEPFTLADNTTQSLPMMHRKAVALYGYTDLYTCVRLPFGSGDKWSMYVLLPVEGKTVDDIIMNLTGDVWGKTAFSPVEVDLKLPRFSTSSDMPLNDVIKGLGALSMFDSASADFSLISRNYKELCVSLIKQKAAIEVTEEGTKTTAVTVAMMLGSNLIDQTAEFHADRPFVYLIQEASSNVIFFIGTFRGK